MSNSDDATLPMKDRLWGRRVDDVSKLYELFLSMSQKLDIIGDRLTRFEERSDQHARNYERLVAENQEYRQVNDERMRAQEQRLKVLEDDLLTRQTIDNSIWRRFEKVLYIIIAAAIGVAASHPWDSKAQTTVEVKKEQTHG